MSFKIAFIGGGSVLWTPRLATDLFLVKGLKGSKLCLVDIDRDAAELLKRYLDKVNAELGCKWSVDVCELDAALDGADCVIASISTGGFETMHNDYTIPEKYGVYHTVSDTVGPGGISRVLRNVPVFIDFARRMERLCPNAWLLHVTNPLTQITRAVSKASSIKCVGLCHEYIIAMHLLKEFFGVKKIEDIDSICVGVNHFTILKDIACKGVADIQSRMTLKKYMQFELKKDGKWKSGTTDDQLEKIVATQGKVYRYAFNFWMYEQLGGFPAAGSAHVGENFPFFNNNPDILKKYGIYRKGVLPQRPANKQERRDKVVAMLEGREPLEKINERSQEMLCDAVESLLVGVPNRIIAAMPNLGQIGNLPRQAVVETWAQASRSGIYPVLSGDIPETYRGFMQQIVDEQELAVDAALSGDFRKVVQAMFVSPLLHRKEDAEKLAAELIAANKPWLPQFK